MVKKAILLLFLVVSVLMHAQRSTFIFEPSMYGGFNVGVNNITAEGAFNSYSPFESVALVGGFHLGFNFAPIIGLKASADLQRFHYPEIRQGVSSLDFSGVGLSLDAMLNLSNVFSYYNLDRKTDFLIFAGLGTLYRSPSNDETLAVMESEGLIPIKSMIPLRLGAQIDYRVNRSLDINLNAMLNVLDDSFNAYINGFRFDLVPKLTVGISYHF